MRRRAVVTLALFAALSIVGYITLAKIAKNNNPFTVEASNGKAASSGSLQVIDPEKGVIGTCPLKHTDVKAEISGFLARVVVTQEFENPFKDKIEAVYTFPLPSNAAVDNMTMKVGDRTVRGKIKRREEARAIYEAAKQAGNVASLLDQERPNIFTQSVANIMPGEKVNITISYVETLKYEDGSYEFVFPMVVGPRYIPGAQTGKQGGGWSPDTNQVPDASRITPPVAAKGTRAGHDISVEVALNAGVPIDALRSTLHDVDVERLTANSAIVKLKNKSEIPNKDFILKYDVAGRRIEDAVLTHRGERGGYFTMILQPPDQIRVEDVTPKELVFVLDTSGSMMGVPIEKAKECMKMALDGLYPRDTFNLITFSGDTHILFPEPVPATNENLAKAQAFLASRQGGGGTEMMKAIRAALDPSDSQQHLRIVIFMTDGYVGNDMEIISEIKKHQNARVFSFGIGQSVNRFLLDKMAEEGRGEVEYVTLQDDGSAAAKRLHERVRSPLLTDISIDWSGLPVADVYPKRIPDLFSAKPVVLSGRYAGSGRGVIKLKGNAGGREFVRDIAVELPDNQPRHDVLATLWARAKVDDLMSQDYQGIQYGGAREDVREEITKLGLDFRLMTQFTSFVAVEEMIVTDGGQPRRVEVPVEMPEGVSHKGVFGEEKEVDVTLKMRATPGPPAMPSAETVTVSPSSRPTNTRQESARKSGGIGTGSGRGVGPGRGNNTGSGNISIGGGDRDQSKPLSPEDQKRQQLLAKLHPSIVAVIERLKTKGAPASADEAKFVRNAKAEIQIWLADKTPQAIEQLKRLGFEVVLDPKTSKMVIGRLPIEKLAELAELTLVRYVAPMTTN